ncbi:MAG: zf-HC2 domain-containing protein [Bacillota bacterium]
MKCEEVSQLLSLYLDNELDELQRKKIDRHLHQCSSCNYDLATLARTVRIIKAVAAVEPPRDYCGIPRISGAKAKE